MTTTENPQSCVISPMAQPCVPVAVTADEKRQIFPVRRIYCVGSNYAEHAREMGASDKELPFFFSKPADAVNTGPIVPFPSMTENLHHEVELVVALGGSGRNVSTEDALTLVYGYAVGVDLTRRDLQAAAKEKGRPWTTAKGFDYSAPISAILPASRCGHPERAAITLAVNGELRQQADIRDMIWSVPEIIAELSRYFELMPGDLIFTGTPSGVSNLRRGDRIACEVSGIGSLVFQLAGS